MRQGQKSRFPCFLATALGTWGLQLTPVSAVGTVWKKHYFLVVWASVRGTCIGVLLNTQRSWWPLPELQMRTGRKGHKVPVVPMTVPTQTPEVLVGTCLGCCSLLWEQKYKLTSSRQEDVWTTHARCSWVHKQMFLAPSADVLSTFRGLEPLSNTLPSTASQGSELQRCVTYHVKIISFNQWCVYS